MDASFMLQACGLISSTTTEYWHLLISVEALHLYSAIGSGCIGTFTHC